MIVSSSVRVAAGATALLLLVLLLPLLVLSSAAAAAASAGGTRAGEPMPPRPSARVDPAVLRRPGTQVRLPPGGTAPPELSARAWLVADAGTGDVLAAHNAHKRLPPASTIKALFALTVLPRLGDDTRHTVTEEELEGIGAGSSLVGVKEDVTYRLSDLWHGVFLHSGNDAVRVLAGLNGGWKATARQMEAKARSLGALDTKVVSPDGYDAKGQVSSAYDLAVFGREGLRNPDFARYCALPYASFPAGGWAYGIRNTNRLITGDDGVARYPGVIGVKNGYTSNAGHTLIAAARRGGRTLVVSVLNPRDGGFRAVYEEARALLDWGFGPGAKVQPVGSLLPPRPVPLSAAAAAGPAGGRARKAVPSTSASAAPSPSTSAPSASATSASARGASATSASATSASARGASAAVASRPAAAAPPSRPASPGAAAPGPAPVEAGAVRADGQASPVLPVVLVGSACVAAATLWMVRRRTAR
ncbi:D-alanyl-D-alanine carboxypeptidase family protein [Streptomyces sp. TRM64462]|uniref:D-alanyl-D-alanine carboxypeptidase family protein n=1 Tax=Streptomyces sp. TRM64462 TaxID=2741726 RepID=UPI001585F0CB|nr:serine hydrolase [Streptomyces sp. TRM64462]